MTNRPSFRHIASPLDVSDDALEKLNRELGVPALVPPSPKQGLIGPDLAADAQKPRRRPSPPPNPDKRATEGPDRSRRDVRLALDVPEYLRDAIHVRAATERCTTRHIVMQGLVKLGFDIEPADLMADGRQQITKR